MTGVARYSAQTRPSRPTRIGVTICCSMSTFTVIRAGAWGLAIRRGGQDWLRSCLSRPKGGRPLGVEHFPAEWHKHGDRYGSRKNSAIQRREMMSHLPIADYALLSDCRSAALVSRMG